MEGVAELRKERDIFRSLQKRLLSWTLEIRKELEQPRVGVGDRLGEPRV